MSPEKKNALPSKSKEEWPLVVKVGAVSVKIYKLKQPDGSIRYCIIWYPGGKGTKRQRETRGTLDDAKERAKEICDDIFKGQVAAGRLTSDQLLQAATAIKLLVPHGLSLDVSAREVDAALKATHGVSIAEMARFWLKHHQASTSKRTPYEILSAMLTAKLSQGLDKEGLRNMSANLRKFCVKFNAPIGNISTPEVRAYIGGLQVSPRMRNNVRGHLITLFNFAQQEGDLVEDRKTAPQRIGKWKEAQKPPAIFSAKEMSDWLSVVREEWQPWLAMNGFSGCRANEIIQMDWADILWLEQQIYVRPEIAKTGQSRYMPLLPNLAEWLLPHRRARGPICPELGTYLFEIHLMKKRAADKWKERAPQWKQNAARHSYGSYRLAIIQDLGKLTVEMGNSIAVNRKNYQNPRSRQSAVEWFSLVPAGSSKIIAASFGR